MGLIIKRPGVLTTIQDLGRVGFRSLGINPNGAMDVTAARLVNIVLGNPDNAPVLEFHFPAPEIEFDSDATIAIGGGDFGAHINETEIQNFSSSFVKKGSLLKFVKPRSGVRAYAAVKGGMEIDRWLGSASTNLTAGVGGISGRKIIAGDRIDCAETAGNEAGCKIGQSVLPRYSRTPTIRIVAGSEFEFLTATAERMLLASDFTLTTDCDRMGYRLSGRPLHLLDDLQMLSSAVAFGTIQLLPAGQLIILMADHQTSGGYPRVANVISTDLPLLAQCGPGDRVRFKIVTVEEAEGCAIQFEKNLNFLRLGLKFRNQDVRN
jgi:antagonist of KipI